MTPNRLLIGYGPTASWLWATLSAAPTREIMDYLYTAPTCEILDQTVYSTDL